LPRTLRQRLKNEAIYASSAGLMVFLGFLPFPWLGSLGRLFGSLVFRWAGGEKKKTMANLRTAYGDAPEPDGTLRTAREVWRGLGRNLFEVVGWLHLEPEEVVSQVARVEGWENLERALEKGKGVLVCSAHLGNWELLGAYLASRHPTSAVAQKLYDPRFDRLVTWLRSDKLGIRMIKRGMALRGILEALRENGIVIALVDQDTGKDGVFVPFFGKDAWTQSGAARIARKTGASLVPAFLVRGGDGRFEIQVEPAVEIPASGDAEKDVAGAVRAYTARVEAAVRAHPDQWMWMHERWKTRPKKDDWPF
jgi:Kdo2-lipid IVA lauroyltransferase/acyltransferase